MSRLSCMIWFRIITVVLVVGFSVTVGTGNGVAALEAFGDGAETTLENGFERTAGEREGSGEFDEPLSPAEPVEEYEQSQEAEEEGEAEGRQDHGEATAHPEGDEVPPWMMEQNPADGGAEKGEGEDGDDSGSFSLESLRSNEQLQSVLRGLVLVLVANYFASRGSGAPSEAEEDPPVEPDDPDGNNEQDQNQWNRENNEEWTEIEKMEERMVELVNDERIREGLEPLEVDPELAKVARLKSEDMVENDYFGHNSPTYGTPFEMMEEFGITYRLAGENIAAGPDVEDAHENLMQSAGHRRNILNEDFTHVGIGIAESGRYGYIYTQMFVGR